jgi:hypothetical protein
MRVMTMNITVDLKMANAHAQKVDSYYMEQLQNKINLIEIKNGLKKRQTKMVQLLAPTDSLEKIQFQAPKKLASVRMSHKTNLSYLTVQMWTLHYNLRKLKKDQ